MITQPVIAHLPKEERIRAIAYAIWQEEGFPEGRDLDHWKRASELVDAEAVGTASPDWLQRTDGEASATIEPVATEEKDASLEELVKRMRGARAA